ncbi:MAG TPA: 23S rRNA methyltransferase [Actinoplanes sp.]|nr:23S rRNA methyltransferase [Actinoplanes sp.]
MIDEALPYLRCPVCERTLSRGDGERTLRCPRGHSFDIARPGYVNLTRGGTPHSGDSAEMIEARAAFLAAGHYAVIADALCAAAAGVAGPVVDAGTGTGWYLARVLDETGSIGIGVDVAKPALRRAARAHPRAAAVLADLWQPLPLVTGAAGLILNVFAPRNGPEFHRILRPDGRLLVVTPAAGHLHELIATYPMIRVDPDKAGRVSGSLGGHFAAVRTATHRTRLTLTGDELRALVGMTPSARHVDVAALPATTTDVTVAVDLTEYRPA